MLARGKLASISCLRYIYSTYGAFFFFRNYAVKLIITVLINVCFTFFFFGAFTSFQIRILFGAQKVFIYLFIALSVSCPKIFCRKIEISQNRFKEENLIFFPNNFEGCF